MKHLQLKLIFLGLLVIVFHPTPSFANNEYILNIGVYQTLKQAKIVQEKLKTEKVSSTLLEIRNKDQKVTGYKVIIGRYTSKESLNPIISKVKTLGYKTFVKTIAVKPPISDKNRPTLYVKSFETAILEAPQQGSAKLISLKRGNSIEKLGEQLPWVKVKSGEKIGWVHQFAVSKTAPKQRVSLLNTKTNLTQTSRKRARTFTSAAAARGLAESGEKMIKARQLPDFNALQKLERQKIDENKAVRFVFAKESK